MKLLNKQNKNVTTSPSVAGFSSNLNTAVYRNVANLDPDPRKNYTAPDPTYPKIVALVLAVCQVYVAIVYETSAGFEEEEKNGL